MRGEGKTGGRKMVVTKQPSHSTVVEGRGVVYVKHVPDGFHEPQMMEYFKQFGTVTRLRLSRSKKTGRSRGYAYVEFASEAVAKIAAESMQDYLMFRQRLMCRFVEPKDLHPSTFKGSSRPFSTPKAVGLARERHNRQQSASKVIASATRLKSRLAKKMSALSDLGVSYELPGISPMDKVKRRVDKSDVVTSTADDGKASVNNEDSSSKVLESKQKLNVVKSSETVNKITKSKDSKDSASVKKAEKVVKPLTRVKNAVKQGNASSGEAETRKRKAVNKTVENAMLKKEDTKLNKVTEESNKSKKAAKGKKAVVDVKEKVLSEKNSIKNKKAESRVETGVKKSATKRQRIE